MRMCWHKTSSGPGPRGSPLRSFAASRAAWHPTPRNGWRVPDVDRQRHLINRGAQVAFDVCCQCFERGNIDRIQTLMRSVGEFCETGKEACQRLATNRGRNQKRGRIRGAGKHVELLRMGRPATGANPLEIGAARASIPLSLEKLGPSCEGVNGRKAW